jgi:hypothetical protein
MVLLIYDVIKIVMKLESSVWRQMRFEVKDLSLHELPCLKYC